MISITLHTRCKGLTLVEMLIALALTLLIMSAAVSVFISTKEGFRLEEDLSVLQENFRFIADRLNKDLSMVGYMGCTPPFKNNSPTVDAFVSGVNIADLIRGTEGGSSPDSIIVSFALPESGASVLDGVITTKLDPVPVSTNQALYQALESNFGLSSPKPTTLLVGNCSGANIFLATGVEEKSVDLDGDGTDDITAGMIKHETGVPYDGVSNLYDELSYAYGHTDDENARIFELEEVAYEIATVSGVTGLYETRNSGSRNLLFEDVTDMQILYGIDSATSEDGNADHYVDWSSGLNVADITSLRVTLTLVVSQSGGADITRDYTFVVKLRNLGLS